MNEASFKRVLDTSISELEAGMIADYEAGKIIFESAEDKEYFLNEILYPSQEENKCES